MLDIFKGDDKCITSAINAQFKDTNIFTFGISLYI